MTKALPLIGITTGEIPNLKDVWAPPIYGQSHTYSDAIIRAGGIPVLLPIIEDEAVRRKLFDQLDGLLFSGGNDVDPTLYGAKPSQLTVDVSTKRDTVETSLLKWALETQKPILAICRGMQLLNVTCGGTLYQDITTELPAASDHQLSSFKEDFEHLAHQLKISPESKLATILNTTTIAANTHHHQAVKDVAPSLVATAWAEDGIVEAVESPDLPYVVAVQCHPESLSRVVADWDQLFVSLVAAAG